MNGLKKMKKSQGDIFLYKTDKFDSFYSLDEHRVKKY